MDLSIDIIGIPSVGHTCETQLLHVLLLLWLMEYIYLGSHVLQRDLTDDVDMMWLVRDDVSFL